MSMQEFKGHKNIGYHRGDLGKSENYFNQSGGRGTGHFGTGTYFCGNPEELLHYNERDGKPAPLHIVDFTPYKLFKPHNESEGFRLHDYLKIINEYLDYIADEETVQMIDLYKQIKNYVDVEGSYYISVNTRYSFFNEREKAVNLLNKLIKLVNKKLNDRYLNADLIEEIDINKYEDKYDLSYAYEDKIKQILNDYKLEKYIDKQEQIQNVYNRLKYILGDGVEEALNKTVLKEKDFLQQGGWSNSYKKDWDSLSTIFMKELGYEGVDVRHLPALDNTSYGSVIYDLKPQTILENINIQKEEKRLLNEAKRSDLINKSKNSDSYSKNNQSKGKNRWERRKFSKISTRVADYNKIDMDAFFRGDILDFIVNVQGETNQYEVLVTFENILNELQHQIKDNNGKLEFKCVLRALINQFNKGDVYVSCSCPDWKYRQAYWSTKGQYNSGVPQPSNGKMKANPNDTKGAGCKHVNLVLANLDWIMKIASVINNYIYWCRDNLEYQYGKLIFPKLYGIPYEKAVQLTLDMYDENGELKPEYRDLKLKSDEQTVNMSNMIGRKRTQYKVKPQTSFNPRYAELHPAKPKEDKNDNKLGLKFGDEEDNEESELVPENEK